MNEKLSILVRVDLDRARAQVAAQGHVTLQSIHALYGVVKRASTALDGLALEVDVTHARIDPAALEQLRVCSQSHHLPADFDPYQADYRFSIAAPRTTFPTTAALGVAA